MFFCFLLGNQHALAPKSPRQWKRNVHTPKNFLKKNCYFPLYSLHSAQSSCDCACAQAVRGCLLTGFICLIISRFWWFTQTSFQF